MSGVKTRRRPREEKEEQSFVDGHINGNPIEHQSTNNENIFLFWPNLIGMDLDVNRNLWKITILGYSRIILAVASLYYMPLHPRTCSGLYSVSCLLDALDGYAARYFEQSTQFGGVLDMVTDRCTTACLLVFLSQAFPRWSLIFQGLLSLDLASHYMHMYATLTMAGKGQSHKKVDSSRSRIMHIYYTNKVSSNLDDDRAQANAR
jgi:CDP-diacylglycerol--inositol 3-phosphatidyltransferase